MNVINVNFRNWAFGSIKLQCQHWQDNVINEVTITLHIWHCLDNSWKGDQNFVHFHINICSCTRDRLTIILCVIQFHKSNAKHSIPIHHFNVDLWPKQFIGIFLTLGLKVYNVWWKYTQWFYGVHKVKVWHTGGQIHRTTTALLYTLYISNPQTQCLEIITSYDSFLFQRFFGGSTWDEVQQFVPDYPPFSPLQSNGRIIIRSGIVPSCKYWKQIKNMYVDEVQGQLDMCLWNKDAPCYNYVKIWQKSLSPTFWPRPTPRGM